MELPDDILGLIREFSRPIGLRLDWRKGCYIKRNMLLELEFELWNQSYYMYRIVNTFSNVINTANINFGIITIIN
jgi:hypothetical protein